MILRDYQHLTIQSIEAGWSSGKRGVQAVCATGAGKTTMAGFIISREAGRVLVTAPTRRLVRQFALSLYHTYGIVCSVAVGGKRDCGKRVLCGTLASIQRGIRKGRWNPEEFDLIVVDESHTSLSNQSLEILRYFKGRILGLTATPYRLDGRDFGLIYQSQVQIKEAQMEALIESGTLKRITVRTCPIRINVSHARRVISDSEANRSVEPYLEALADSIAENIGQRAGVIFLPLIETSKMFSELLNRRGIRSIHLDGTMGEKAVDAGLSALENGEVQVICNPLLLGVGVDVPCISFVSILRPTTSFVQYVQQAGRGIRKWEGSEYWPAVSDMILFDPIWQSERLNLLQGPHTIFSSNPDESELFRSKIQSTECDLLRAISQAKADREGALRRLAIENSLRRERLVSLEDLRGDQFNPSPRWSGSPMTEGQRKVLISNGFDIESFSNQAEAREAINLILQRASQGLAPYRLAKICKLKGIRNAFSLTAEQAGAYVG